MGTFQRRRQPPRRGAACFVSGSEKHSSWREKNGMDEVRRRDVREVRRREEREGMKTQDEEDTGRGGGVRRSWFGSERESKG